MPRKIFLVFLGSLISFSLLGCEGSQGNFGSIGLGFQEKVSHLTNWERSYIEGDYTFLATQEYQPSWNPKEQYVYLRSLFHLKEWGRLAGIFHSGRIPFQDSLLGPYFLALALETDIQNNNLLSAKNHYQMFQDLNKRFSPYLGMSLAQNSYAAFVNVPAKAASIGGFHYYRYKQNPSRKGEFLKALREKYPEAMKEADWKEFHKALPSRSSWVSYLPFLKESGSPLYLDVLAHLGYNEKLSQIYFQKRQYAKAYRYAPRETYLYFASSMMMGKGVSPKALHYAQEHLDSMGGPLSYYEFIKKDYTSLSRLELKNYVPQSLRYLLVLGLNNEPLTKLYQNLRDIVLKYANTMLPEDRELGLFWLGVLSDYRKKSDEARQYYKRIAAEFPNSYYGSEAIEELNSSDREEIFESFKKDYAIHRERVRALIQEANTQKFPDEGVLQRALFFLRIRENERGKAYLNYFLKGFGENIKPSVFYALAEDFYGTADRTDYFYYYFRKFFKALQEQVPGAFLFSDILPLLYPKKFDDIIEKASKTYNFSPSILEGLILQESLFDPFAQSSAGARGLSQLMPATFNSMSKRLLKQGLIQTQNIWDVQTNVFVGAAYLSWLMNKVFKDFPPEERINLSYASYNAGLGHIRKILKTIHYPLLHSAQFVESIDFLETRNYTKKLIQNQKIYSLIRHQS